MCGRCLLSGVSVDVIVSGECVAVFPSKALRLVPLLIPRNHTKFGGSDPIDMRTAYIYSLISLRHPSYAHQNIPVNRGALALPHIPYTPGDGVHVMPVRQPQSRDGSGAPSLYLSSILPS